MVKLCISICLLALIVSTVDCAVLQAIAKLGEPYSIDLGPKNSVIKRQWNEESHKSPQFIHVSKDYWTNEKGDKFDEGNVHLFENGTLAFDKIKKDDYAFYTLPDEPVHKVGAHAAVGPSMINIREE